LLLLLSLSVSVDEFSDGFVAVCEIDGVLRCFNVFLFHIMDIYLWTKGICVFCFFNSCLNGVTFLFGSVFIVSVDSSFNAQIKRKKLSIFFLIMA